MHRNIIILLQLFTVRILLAKNSLKGELIIICQINKNLITYKVANTISLAIFIYISFYDVS